MAIVKMINNKSQSIQGLLCVLAYACKDAKTNHEGQQLISGINCMPHLAFDEFMTNELPTLCYVSMAELDSIVSEVRKQFESFQKDFFFQLNMSMERFLWQEQIDNPDETVLNREPIGDGNEIVKTVDRYSDKLFKAD